MTSKDRAAFLTICCIVLLSAQLTALALLISVPANSEMIQLLWQKDRRSDRDLFRFGSVSQRYGFISSSGAVVLRPKKGQPTIKGDFFEGLAVAWDEWFGYIDVRGNWVIPPKFMAAADFSSGLAAVRVGERWGYVDRQGELAIAPQYDEAGDFHDDRAAIRKGDRYGYIDRSGNLVVPSRYSVAHSFSHKRAWVVREPGPCWVTAPMDDQANARRRIGPGDSTLMSLHEIPNCRYELIDQEGTAMGDRLFDDVHDFSEGRAAVAFYNKFGATWGYINDASNFVLPPEFGDAKPFSGGLAAVRPHPGDRRKGWGYINLGGDFVIEPSFDEASGFSDGLAAVTTLDMERRARDGFYIDRSGSRAFPSTFLAHSDFVHGLALVMTSYGEPPLYIDTSGKVVFANSNEH